MGNMTLTKYLQDTADETASNVTSLCPDHPDLHELGSIADLSSRFTSITAKKMMAGGGSITSIDTLIEVNNVFNRSSDTIDFGVI